MGSLSLYRSAALLVGSFAASGLAAGSEPIYLKPGQCILVGSQQVCAMSSDQPGAGPQKAEKLFVCRYGVHEGAEVPNMKSYALVQILTQPTGSKTETIVKNYGMGDGDKEACQKEADSRTAAQDSK